MMHIIQALVFIQWNKVDLILRGFSNPQVHELMQAYHEIRRSLKRLKRERVAGGQGFPFETLVRFYELAQWAETHLTGLEYPSDYHTLTGLDLEELANEIL